MSWLLIILLIVVGLLLLLLEVLVIPGTTIAAVIGFGSVFVALWQTYVSKGATAGHITLISTILFTIIMLYIAFKTGTWKRMALKTSITGKVDSPSMDLVQVGDSGYTISRLAPAGKILINNQIIEAHTYSEFIDQETEISVIAIKDNKVIVTSKKNNI